MPAHAETRAAPRDLSTCSKANWPETALSPPQLALDHATSAWLLQKARTQAVTKDLS